MPDDRPSRVPEFGPSGYLPERASARARKIVLRAPLGLQWVVASLVAGVVVAIAGMILLTRGEAAPGPPWVELGAVEDLVGEVAHDTALGVLLVGIGGRVAALEAPAEVAYCPASGRLEDGTDVWNLTGRSLTEAPSLPEHPVRIVEATAYVDPTVTAPAPSPARGDATPAC
ncbi:hypothetical protein FTX61_14620 [Nitriliruptoraceae bacterium ZYF776]|nr:hypothetical protein [Profundirhabdus halotolerans]